MIYYIEITVFIEIQVYQYSNIISYCYDSKLKVLSNETTLVLSDTRELDRELFYKLVYLI